MADRAIVARKAHPIRTVTVSSSTSIRDHFGPMPVTVARGRIHEEYEKSKRRTLRSWRLASSATTWCNIASARPVTVTRR